MNSTTKPIPEIELVRNHLLSLQVCTSKTDLEEIINWVNSQGFNGITEWTWVLVPSSICPDPNPNQCEERETHKHYLFYVGGDDNIQD